MPCVRKLTEKLYKAISLPEINAQMVLNKKNVVAPIPEIRSGLTTDLLGPLPTIPMA